MQGTPAERKKHLLNWKRESQRIVGQMNQILLQKRKRRARGDPLVKKSAVQVVFEKHIKRLEKAAANTSEPIAAAKDSKNGRVNLPISRRPFRQSNSDSDSD